MKLEVIIIIFAAYIIITAVVGPIIVYNNQIGVQHDSNVTFIGGMTKNVSLLTKYYYFGPDSIAVKTNEVDTNVFPSYGCYTYVMLSMAVCVNSTNITYSFPGAFITYPVKGNAVLIYPSEGAIFFKANPDFITPVPFLTNRVVSISSGTYYVDRNGIWTVKYDKDILVMGMKTYLMKPLSSTFTVDTNVKNAVILVNEVDVGGMVFPPMDDVDTNSLSVTDRGHVIVLNNGDFSVARFLLDWMDMRNGTTTLGSWLMNSNFFTIAYSHVHADGYIIYASNGSKNIAALFVNSTVYGVPGVTNLNELGTYISNEVGAASAWVFQYYDGKVKYVQMVKTG